MDDVTPGQRLAALRKAAGLLQRQVGAAFNIDKAAVSEWERGKSNPGRDRLLALDEMYGADGEVLRLYGVAPDTSNQISQLRSEVVDLRETMERLRQEVAGLSTDAAGAAESLASRIDVIERRLPDQRAQG